MKREEIEDTKKGNLVHLINSKNLLVSFGGIRQGLGIPVFEFFNSISDIECDKIFLRDFHQAWYQKGVDTEINHIDKLISYLKEITKNNDYKKICFIGNSMGGYAAILFGSIINADTVISFAPQSFINKFNRYIYSDKRWADEMSEIYKYKHKRKDLFDLRKYLSKHSDYTTKINIYYSPNHRLDKVHSERLKDEKNIILHPIEEGGHSVVKTVRDRGELKTLIKSTFERE